jgi:hypothetical protein
MSSYPIHPACAAWPRLSDNEILKLAEDIKANGLHNPIWLTKDNQIIDGRMRDMACGMAEVTPRYQTYEGDDPIGFTVSQNERRRHMNKGALALIGKDLAKLKRGQMVSRDHLDTKTRNEVAQQLGISSHLISDARVLEEKAEEHVIEAVKTGELGIKNAVAYARHVSREQQRNETVAEIKRKAGAYRTPNKTGVAKKKPRKSERIERPYLKLEVATNEETEKPPPGSSFMEISRWRDEIGSKVPLFSMNAKRMMDANRLAIETVGLVSRLHNELNVADFLTGIDKMLQHKIKAESTSGDQRDFARMARERLRSIHKCIDQVFSQLEQLRAGVRQRLGH